SRLHRAVGLRRRRADLRGCDGLLRDGHAPRADAVEPGETRVGSACMFALTILGGALVGLFLGLTGAGGALLAVPFLVYGLSVEPAQAVLVSLVAVAITSLLGAAN